MKYFIPFLTIYLLLITCTKDKSYLFKRLNASYTGISFSNDLMANDTLNAFNFTNFYNGGGVGIADFNNDGLPDICFTANQKASELYIGKGKLQFEKVNNSGFIHKGWVTGISIIDINQDGWQDIYLSVAAHPSLQHTANQLYINQKTTIPSFKEQAADYGLAYEGFTTQTAFFDYDRDGDLDAYLLNTAPDHSNPNNLRPTVNDGSHPSSDKLFKNVGRQADGTFRFEDASLEAGIRYEGLGLGIALADFNEDSFIDIYCSSDFQSDDALYLNQGNGTFRNVIKQVVKHTSLYGMGVDVADFNNDLRQDIFQLDMLPDNSERQKQMIARGDFDKKQLSTSPQYGYNLQYMRNTLQVNQGVMDSLPYFSEQGLMYNIAMTDWSWSVLMADYDLDGWKDIFITNGYRKNVTDLDFINYNQNQNMFGDAKSQEQNRQQFLAAIPEIKLSNYGFKNIPNTNFQNVSEEWGLNELSYSNGAAYADLDLDGDLDLVINNIDENAWIYENRSHQKNYIKIAFKGAAGNLEGIGTKVQLCTNDTCQIYQYFPVRGYLSSMNTPMVIGLGKHQKIDRLEITWSSGKKQIIENVTAGQSYYFEEANATKINTVAQNVPQPFFKKTDNLKHIHQPSDFVDFRQTPTLQKMLTRNAPVLAQGDFNGDQLPDIVIGGTYRGSPTIVYHQQPNGNFLAADTLTTSITVGDIALLDANKDGLLDIFLVPGVSERPISAEKAYQPLLFLGAGNGFALYETLPNVAICSESVLATDLNADGFTDLLLGGGYLPNAYPQYCPSVLLTVKDGKLSQMDAPWLPKNMAIKAMKALDVENDGDQDLLLTGHWENIKLLRNNGNTYTLEDLNLPKGWWNCIQTADLDGDNDLDLVLGNEGLNTVYKATPEQPVTLLAKDFNQDGRIDPIFGTFLANQEVAIHPLGTLSDQIVQFKKRFTQFQSYATTDLQNLFTAPERKDAQRLQVTELRSGIATNDGKGNFTFQPLPFAVQQAPINDLLIHDFNADGILDLLLIGNFYPNESIFGQSDASFGNLLLGKGNLEFELHPLPKSGLHLDGDMRKILLLTQQKLLVATQNQGEVLTYSF